MSAPQMLRVMPREMRMMTERVLSLTALPKGFALMAGDAVMVSQAMGQGGFALLEARQPDLLSATPSALSLDGDVLDCAGQHAWIALPSALDLLGLSVAQGGDAVLQLTDLLDPAELVIAEGLGPRTGLSVTVDGTTLRASAIPAGDPLLEQILHTGCQIPADLWWRIYALAQTALTPDSLVSRRHAGPVIVTEDGKIIGRKDNDDDTDVGFLASVAPKTQEQNA